MMMNHTTSQNDIADPFCRRQHCMPREARLWRKSGVQEGVAPPPQRMTRRARRTPGRTAGRTAGGSDQQVSETAVPSALTAVPIPLTAVATSARAVTAGLDVALERL